ncbi:MAG TPA: sulfurtransferase TusA family protein [Dehalococcoidia bacterium]|jgi:TusA-related sulfurtransferase|nr:sulfurtransferase TusA family protein [Dehalococcoidia bacterium]
MAQSETSPGQPPEPQGEAGLFALLGVTPAETLEGGELPAGPALLLSLRGRLAGLTAGQVLELRSRNRELGEDLRAWCRLNGCELTTVLDAGDHLRFFITKGRGAAAWGTPDWGVRLTQRRPGTIDLRDWFVGRAGDVPDEAPTYYGFIPRGAVPEPGMPALPFTLNRKLDVWADNLPDLYEQAKAQQWNATTDVPWASLAPLPDELERAVCQIMTFLAENEYAALYIPAKFLPRINARYAEAVLFLGTIINDEARHIEAFTKRALANGGGLQYAAALTEWSLQSLLVQEDYFRSSFLLHVLGEGTFLDLLEFIERFAPDPATADVARRARLDEGRHVAYGIAHVRAHLQREPASVVELAAATEERAAALQATSGANPVVMHALAVLAGGGAAPLQLAGGLDAVRALYKQMAENRVRRLLQIGLDAATAARLSELHTPNFM